MPMSDSDLPNIECESASRIQRVALQTLFRPASVRGSRNAQTFALGARCIVSAVLALPLGLSGCATAGGQGDLRRELDKKNERIAALERENAALRAAADESHRQMEVARGITPGERAQLVAPEKITIDTRSGTADLDGKPGDDGLLVHLKLFDREGDAIKAAGDIRIDAFDLTDPANPRTVGTWSFTAEQAAKMWLGKLMTYHYTLKCPWQNGAPTAGEVTVRVTFVDLMTKRVLTIQQPFALKTKAMPAATQP